MIPWWWSWLLTIYGITGLYFAGSSKKIGWLIGLSAQILWIAYAITTHQYGFIFSALAYGTVYARNWVKWNKAEKNAKIFGKVVIGRGGILP